MEAETKEKVNWTRLIITSVIVLVTAGAVGGGVWYVMNENLKTIQATDDKTTADLQKQIDALEKASITQTTTPAATTSTTPTTLTNDQIFQETATQLGLTRSGLVYFRIFGQDKVQYSTGQGTIFAYKSVGKWNKLSSGTGLASCTAFTGVPTAYMPPCFDENNKELYVNSNGQFTNYPMSSAVSYIGQ